jgi:hypothetical protein
VTGLGIIAGPALGGILLLLGPSATAIALNALTFGLSALAVLAIRAGDVFRPARSAERPAGLLRQVAQGAAALRARPWALRHRPQRGAGDAGVIGVMTTGPG